MKNFEEELQDLKSRIENFSKVGFLTSCQPHEDAKTALNLTKEELKKSSADECYEHAYSLTTYQFYLHQRLSERECELDWCNFAINTVVGKEWENYDQYLPSEPKIAAIIADNSFLKVVENGRRVILEASLLIKGKIEIIEQKIRLLEIIGKRKQYR